MPTPTEEDALNQLTETGKQSISVLGRLRLHFIQISSSRPGLMQSGISLIDQGVVSAVNFLTGVIIARSCSKEEFGLYSLAFSLTLILADLQSSLIMTPYMINAPRLKGRAHALYTGSTLIHQSMFCIATMVVLFCAALVTSSGIGPKGVGSMFWSLAFVITLIMLREHARRVSFARLQLMTALIFDTSIALVQITGLVLLAHFRSLSANRAYWVIGIACGVAVLGWLWWDRDFYEPRMKEALADFKRNWILGKWVLAGGVLWTIGVNLYPWLLATVRGVASTGVWAACLGVVSVGNPVLIGLQNLTGPKIAHEYAANGTKSLNRMLLKMTAISAAPIVVLCVLLFFSGGPLLVRLYGQQYSGNEKIILIMSLNVLVTAIIFPLSRALFAMERADVEFALSLITVLSMITVGIWLVRSFGPIGAAAGLLGANFLTLVVRYVVFLKISAKLRKFAVNTE